MISSEGFCGQGGWMLVYHKVGFIEKNKGVG